MESGRKKRKMGNEEEEEEDVDEEKVEMFFALIRSTREMRDRLRSVPDGSQEQKEKKKQAEKTVATVWNPTFQPEDFMEDSDYFKKPLVVNDAGPSSQREQEQEKEKETNREGGEDSGLDLKLSL